MDLNLKKIILVCALSAVSIMCVGLFLYDYIPSGLTVSKPNRYEVDATTTAVLSDVVEAQKLLNSQSQATTSTPGETTPVKTNIVLKEYNVSKTDLAMYKQSGSYVQGKSDPFAEAQTVNTNTTETTPTVPTPSTSTSTNTVSSGQTGSGSTSSSSQSSDGTFYNSKNKK